MHQANTMNVKIMVIEDAIKDTSGRLVLAYEQAKEERRVQVSQKKASDKTAEAADKRQLAAYTNASSKTPFNLAKYLRDNKAIEVPAQTVMVNMDKIEADEDALPCDRLSYIPAGPFGVAGRLGKLVDSLDNQRFARTWNRLQEAVMAKEANGLCMQRLPPRGHPFDTLEKLEWLPTEWNVAKLIPQKLADFGTPILMANKYACTRMGFGDMPMIGIGQFIINTGGEFVLCAWPGRSVVDRGADWIDGESFVFHLDNKLFTKWADEHMKYVLVHKGDTVFVPYGYACCMTACSGVANALLQPIISAELALASPDLDKIYEAHHLYVDSVQDDDVWAKVSKMFIGWLDCLVNAGDGSHGRASALTPLEDGKVDGAVNADDVDSPALEFDGLANAAAQEMELNPEEEAAEVQESSAVSVNSQDGVVAEPAAVAEAEGPTAPPGQDGQSADTGVAETQVDQTSQANAGAADEEAKDAAKDEEAKDASGSAAAQVAKASAPAAAASAANASAPKDFAARAKAFGQAVVVAATKANQDAKAGQAQAAAKADTKGKGKSAKAKSTAKSTAKGSKSA